MPLKIFGFTLLAIAVLYVIWINLPPAINRYSDIKLGNQIIAKIDEYKKTNGLPDRDDWQTLRQFGFRVDGDVWTPQYQKVNSQTYELVFVEGFDGPYLLWNSSERKWKIDMPTVPADYYKN